VRFSNPVLPRTRSEMALPLIARDRVVGALTIQSDQPEAFSPEDILSLQSMADLIAIALDNARLFQETQRALEEVSAVHKTYLSQAWSTFARTHSEGEEKVPTYIYADNTLSRGESITLPGLDQAVVKRRPIIATDESASTLTLPIKLRDQVIGALAIESDSPDHIWSPDELALIEAVTEQAALSLENARLIEEAETALAETRRLAAREQTVNTISSKIRRLPGVESILTTALVELGRTLGASKGQVRLGSQRRTTPAEVSDE
jgi:GAF domain-containing protein